MNDKSSPMRRPAMADAALRETQPFAGVGHGMRVLIAEDERDTLMTLGILLRSEGFEVHLVAAAAEVGDQVEQFQPHAVLLDIGMPQRDGYEVAHELRSKYGDSCPTLIAVTAYTSAADKVRAHKSGFHHHVGKPYDPLRLLALLATLRKAA